MKYCVLVFFLLLACNQTQGQRESEISSEVHKGSELKQESDVQQKKELKQDSLKFEFEVIDEIYHNPVFYTQGYIFLNGYLYESIGQYGHSALHKIDPNTGKSLKETKVGFRYFAEGLEVLDDKLFLLTWKNEVCKVYDIETFSEVSEFPYVGEGWGLCEINNLFYMSDGSDKIQIKEPNSFSTIEKFSITGEDNLPLNDINELEYAKGYIFANIWMTDKIAIIDPNKKELVKIMDFSVLRKRLKNNPSAESFNGIAYNPKEDIFYLTGKYWNKVFKVKIK